MLNLFSGVSRLTAPSEVIVGDDLGNVTRTMPLSLRERAVYRFGQKIYVMFAIVMLFCALGCITIVSYLIPIIFRPMVEAYPAAWLRDPVLKLIDYCPVVHYYSFKLFKWLSTPAWAIIKLAKSAFISFLGWIETL